VLARELDDTGLRGRGRHAADPAAEQRRARRVRKHEGQGRENGREVQDDVGHVDAREATDQREDGMPERHGIAGMHAAVGKLAQRAKRIEAR
jgi:hypothetical protein